MSKKGHGSHEEHMDESWLIPYADLLTLLLALFIVLFASSSVDSNKYEAMQESLGRAFYGTVLDDGAGILSNSGNSILEYINLQELVPPTPEVTDGGENLTSEQIVQEQEKQIDNLQGDFKEFTEQQGISKDIKVVEKDNGLLITLIGDVWFESGKATLTNRHKKIAKELTRIIVDSEKKKYNRLEIVVSGHTDNIPISNKEFRSNLHLSAERALNFVDVMLLNKKLHPEQCSMKGIGERQPIASNSTPEGRQKNRRVEVFIYPSYE